MFTDASVVGSWDALAARLDQGILAEWAAREPELVGFGCVANLLSAWDDPVRTHRVGDALVRLAAADGGADMDALMVVLHLASPVVWRLVGQLGDLDPDIASIAVSEACCLIRAYPWRTREGGLLTNLERDIRAAVLADVRPSSRHHPERVERLTLTGEFPETAVPINWGDNHRGAELMEMLAWAIRRGVPRHAIDLLLACGEVTGREGDAAIAASLGISVRTLYRRKARTLTRLQATVMNRPVAA